jgi:hypothetical protein
MVRTSKLGMGRIEAISLAYERSGSRNKSNRYSRTFQPQRFDHELVSRAGTRAGSDKATVRIHGIGRRWRNLWVFPQTPDT